MARSAKIVVFLMLAAAIPATAHTFDVALAPAAQACLAIGDTTYRVATGMRRPDLTVRIDPAAATPHVRIAFAETPDVADFVLVDDGSGPPACQHSARTKSVTIDSAAVSPDLVVGFADAGATPDYRIYLRSRWIAPETAAALFAATHAPAKNARAAQPVAQIEAIALARRQP